MDFTRLMGNVYSDLDIEFKSMCSNESLNRHFDALKNSINQNKNNQRDILDTEVIEKYSKIVKILTECIDDFSIPKDCDLRDVFSKYRSMMKLKSTDRDYVEQLKSSLETQVDVCLKYISESISAVPSIEKMDEIFVKKIEGKYLAKTLPSSGDYLTRVVLRRLSKISPEFVCVKAENGVVSDAEGYAIDKEKKRILRNDLPSTKLLILKQFIKVFGWGEGVADTDEARRGMPICSEELKDYIKVKYDGSKKKAAVGIDESIFSEFANAQHRGLFLIAERLSEGMFNDKQLIREDLYIFSIAFGMTFSSDLRSNITADDTDYETDIRKNLFFDYYCENLFNFDLDKNASVKRDDASNDSVKYNRRKYIPGYGPNYRNYVEMIYIYYIGRTDLSELQKLQGAKAMIKYCMKHGKKSCVDETTEDDSLLYKPTEYYRTTAFAEIRNKKDDEFRDYILENFVCGVEKLTRYDDKFENIVEINRTISRMNINAAHVTAAEFYSELLLAYEKAKDDTNESSEKTAINFDKRNSRVNNLIEKFNDLRENEKVLRRWYISLDDMNKWSLCLCKTYNDTQFHEEILEYDDHFVVNRTDLEILLTDYAVVKFSKISSDKQKEVLSNFKSFYDYLSKEMTFNILEVEYTGISSVLVACGYQEICSKNIFDILIIYLTYKKIMA